MCPCSSKTVTSIKAWSCLARLLVDAMRASALGRLQGFCCAKLLYLWSPSQQQWKVALNRDPLKMYSTQSVWSLASRESRDRRFTVLPSLQQDRLEGCCLKGNLWNPQTWKPQFSPWPNIPTSQQDHQPWHQATVVGHPSRGEPRPRSGKPGLNWSNQGSDDVMMRAYV